MITKKQIKDFANVMIKHYGRERAMKRCSYYISMYEKKVDEFPEMSSDRFSHQILLEFYKDVYLHLNLI